VELAGLRQQIAAFCRAEAFLLVTTFCDVGYDGSEMARPGFAALLDALSLPRSTRLVVPDLRHLSTDAAVREGLLRQVRRTGVSVLVAHEVNGRLADTGVTNQSAWIGRDDGGEPS
jgi:DNA invertase Pin-like site-specific DNA recombinase